MFKVKLKCSKSFYNDAILQELYKPVFFNILYYFHGNICISFPVKERNKFVEPGSSKQHPQVTITELKITAGHLQMPSK